MYFLCFKPKSTIQKITITTLPFLTLENPFALSIQIMQKLCNFWLKFEVWTLFNTVDGSKKYFSFTPQLLFLCLSSLVSLSTNPPREQPQWWPHIIEHLKLQQMRWLICRKGQTEPEFFTYVKCIYSKSLHVQILITCFPRIFYNFFNQTNFDMIYSNYFCFSLYPNSTHTYVL